MTVVLNPADSEQSQYGVNFLKQATPVALPTETVYGLAGLACSEEALGKIFHLKNRPKFDPLIVHALDLEQLKGLIHIEYELQERLVQAFWPGPLTVLFKKTDRIPGLCTAGSPWVACRSPSHEVFRQVLEALNGEVLAAPSANRFAGISTTTARDVVSELGPYGLEAVFDGGPCYLGLESTVVKVMSENSLEIIRKGSLTVEEIQKSLSSDIQIEFRQSGSGVETEAIDAPGQLKKHYAPQKPLFFTESLDSLEGDFKEAALLVVLQLDRIEEEAAHNWGEVCVLSGENSELEAASKLFATLRRLDADPNIKRIVALKTQEQGLGRAINDRLSRAQGNS